MRLFGRRPSALALLRAAHWRCASCGGEHEGLMDLGAAAPDYWDQPQPPEENAALRLDGHFLSEDFCVLDGAHYFIRGLFPIPVHGLNDVFAFGVWSTLSRAHFDRYVEGFDAGDYEGEGPWSGWFSTRIAGFPETVPQACWVWPRAGRLRPTISLMDEAHPLQQAQRDGVPAERILELYRAYGHHP